MVKHIPRYLTATQQMGLWYPKGANCDLFRYIDSDFARWNLDSKSITGKCYLLKSLFLSWHTKKQASDLLSTS